jgi:hypothetical protein
MVFGFATFAAAIVGIWICKANKDGTKKVFLRGIGFETAAAIAITACLGFGIPMAVAGIAQFGF